ncbi:MAG: short-chain dehydrogenase [Robiginitomaculum sp.]|nr:MAG: short-chain dehydrogenase [Robiginitomaculum sp.]
MKLIGKTVLVTGASGGIGAVIATQMAEAGANLLLGYGRNQQSAEQVRKQIVTAGGEAICIGFDVAQETEVEAVFARMANDGTLPDILINNAGAFPMAELLTMEAKQWDDVQAINLRSAFLCAREAVKAWRANQSAGVIVNIASIAASLAQEQIDHYSAAKAGMLALARNMAREFGPDGIRVNTVSPGLVWRKTLADDWPEGVARWNKAAPLGRVVQPNDIAKACLFLASNDASAITGINLTVDAGISVALPF